MSDHPTSRGTFFRNYDLYETPGKDEGPGTGLYSNMDKYKSVADFLKKKRKKNKARRKKLAMVCLAAELDVQFLDFVSDDLGTPILPEFDGVRAVNPVGILADDYFHQTFNQNEPQGSPGMPFKEKYGPENETKNMTLREIIVPQDESEGIQPENPHETNVLDTITHFVL